MGANDGAYEARASVRFRVPSRPGEFALELRGVPDGASRALVVVDPGTLEVLRRVELPFQPHQSSVSGR